MTTKPAASTASTPTLPPYAGPPGAGPATRRHRRRWPLAAAMIALLSLLALAACAAGNDSSSDSGTSAGEAMVDTESLAADSGADPGAVDGAEAPDGAQSETAGGATKSGVDTAALATQRAVISTGNVALRGTDVGALRFDVRQVVDEHQGQVSDEQTESDADGRVVRSRLVVRVPAKEFDATMAALEEVGDVESSQRTSEDVTTQVIDTDVRVRAQQASLRRIETLLGQAKSLRDIVAIESELTRRQADLDSLKQQQVWLADQTSMSTITVQLRRTAQHEVVPKTDDTGFLAGLYSGWGALKSVTNGGLTAFGAVLPFVVVLLALGLPLGYVLRRIQRRRSRPGTGEAAAA